MSIFHSFVKIRTYRKFVEDIKSGLAKPASTIIFCKMASFGVINIARGLSTSSAKLGKLVQSPVPMFGVEGRYAHALYSAACKEKKLDKVEKDIGKLSQFMKTDPKFAQFVSDPSLKRQHKKAAMVSTMKKQGMTDLTTNALAAMAENGRLPKLGAILRSFDTIMGAHRGEVVCTITTAKALDAPVMTELTTALKGFLKEGQSLQLSTKVDPAILGGMVVTIGDKYVDMSTSSKIKTYTGVIKQDI